jgi:signal peptidase I
MNPILRTGDLLGVVSYNGRKVHRGDVIVFLPQDSDYNVVHRVISVDSNEIRTRGDNNSDVDSWISHYDDIIGRVIYAQRRNRWRRIYGGLAGRLSAFAVRFFHTTKLYILSLLKPIYHYLVQSGIMIKYIPVWKKTRIISFNRPGGTELQLLMGQRVIGRRLPGMMQWQIKPLFRLFVDEASLPSKTLHYPSSEVVRWIEK